MPRRGIHGRKSTPALKERLHRQRGAAERSQLSDRFTVPSHGYSLARHDAIDDLAALVAQLANRDFSHLLYCITGETPLADRRRRAGFHRLVVSQFVVQFRGISHAISVRLDDEAERALRALEAAGMSRSEAIRTALITSARRLRRSSELAAEVAALEADEGDREEMLAVAGLMESLRAAR